MFRFYWKKPVTNLFRVLFFPRKPCYNTFIYIASGGAHGARRWKGDLAMGLYEQARELCGQLTLEEKTRMVAGKDFWHLHGVERLGLPEIMVTDGPHGLRKQSGAGDHLGLGGSVPATCFPTASALACTFDTGLLAEVGASIGEECRQEDVAVLLGPGANMKRSPLCGRNFEYFSEDPLLAGKLAAAFISGVQSRGVGTSLKHFAANSQEKNRLTTDSVIDERALREMYLKAFEIAVKEAQPWTVMTAYNKLNGTYCSENQALLTETLRGEWGFEGLVMTDWGAMNDCVESYRAGLDLQMPGPSAGNDQILADAVRTGRLPEDTLDAAVTRVIELILKYQEGQKIPYECDAKRHLALARKAAAESAVLLKNNGALPGNTRQNIAVIGAFAKTPRYQGAGSSRINPLELDCAYDAFEQAGCTFEYAPGYSLEDDQVHEELVDAAVALARGKDIVYLFAGLPDSYESEGFDRTTLGLPDSHYTLIERVCAANDNTVVILQAGSPVKASWADHTAAIVMAYLGGCQGGKGIVDVLLGKQNFSGRLAETFPRNLADTPSADNYPAVNGVALYRENIFIGYRYYDAAQKKVRWPFGHGLSYTTFEYAGLTLDHEHFAPGKPLTVRCTVKNTGAMAGKETVQLYVAPQIPVLYCPPRQLRAFAKVDLAPGEAKEVVFTLDDSAFQYYDFIEHGWRIEGGVYDIEIGASSRDIRLKAPVDVPGDTEPKDWRKITPLYYERGGFSSKEFEKVYGAPLPLPTVGERPYTLNSTLGEIKDTFVGKRVYRQALEQMANMGGDDPTMRRMMEESLDGMPLRQLMMAGVPREKVLGILEMVNGNLFGGLKGLLKK